MNVWQQFIVDAKGNILAGAEVQVFEAGTATKIAVYKDRAGTDRWTDDVAIADADGFVRLYAAAGNYDIEADKDGNKAVFADVMLGNAQQKDVGKAVGKLPEYEDDGSGNPVINHPNMPQIGGVPVIDRGSVHGIKYGVKNTDLRFATNWWDGSSNLGEVDVEGSFFTDYKGNIIDVTPINNGCSSDDSWSGIYYIMYSEESVHTRFSPNPSNADHLIVVHWDGSQWLAENNLNDGTGPNTSFTPVSTDRLIARGWQEAGSHKFVDVIE